MCFYYLENWECIPLFDETNVQITAMLLNDDNILSAVIEKFKSNFCVRFPCLDKYFREIRCISVKHYTNGLLDKLPGDTKHN